MNLIVGCKSYLTDEEIQRNNIMKTNRLLYKGKAKKVFLDNYRTIMKGIRADDKEYINLLQKEYETRYTSANIVKPIVDIFANLLFSESLIISAEEKEEISELVKLIKLQRSCLKAEKASGQTGNAIMYAWRDENGVPKLSVAPSEHWFPVPYAEDTNMVESNLLVSYYLEENNDKIKGMNLFDSSYKGKKVLLAVRRFEANRTYYEAYKLDGAEIKECIP